MIPTKYMNKLTALDIPGDKLKKVIAIFIDAIEAKEVSRVAKLPDDLRWPTNFMEMFWSRDSGYPRLIGKQAAFRKLQAIQRSGKVRFADLMAGVERYRQAAAQTDPCYIAHPATWLSAGRWEDDPGAVRVGSRVQRGNGFLQLLDQANEREPSSGTAEARRRPDAKYSSASGYSRIVRESSGRIPPR